MTDEKLEWKVWCLTCNKQIDACANGRYAEVIAEKHARDNWGHHVMVGYTVQHAHCTECGEEQDVTDHTHGASLCKKCALS